jgi:hypothetical protein
VIAVNERVRVLVWLDHEQVVLPATVTHVTDTLIAFNVDTGLGALCNSHVLYPLNSEGLVWVREGTDDSAVNAMRTTYALHVPSPMPAGPTGSVGPRLSRVWL